MTDRDIFERQLAEAVRVYAEGAPTGIDAAALARSLAATTPHTRRLVRVPAWRLPNLGFAWSLLVLAALMASMIGVSVAGGLPDLHLFGIVASPAPPTASLPAVTPTAPPVASAMPSRPAQATPPPTDAIAPTRAPVPTAAPLPAATAAPPYGAELLWSGFAQAPRFDAGHALTDPTIGDVVAGGPGFVAVGSDWVDDDTAVAVAWLSTDGRTWTEHAIGTPGKASLLASPALSSVTAGEEGLVAVGRVGIWHSIDGSDWALSLDPDELDGVPLHVAWAAGRFVALGRGVGDSCSARVWESTGGAAWMPVALPDAQGICPTGLAAGAGGFVAVGLDPLTGGTEMMVSPDGLAWKLAPAQSAFRGHGYPEGVTWAGDRWVAFGSFLPAGASERGVAVWTSPDGLSWLRTAFLRPAGTFACDPGSAHLLDVAPFGPGYVAVGRCTVSPEQVGIAWASTDGSTWETVLGRVPPMFAVAANGARLVTVGADWPSYTPVTSSAILAP